MQRPLSVPIWLSARVPAVPRLWDTCKHNEGTPEKTIHMGLLGFVVSLNVSLMTSSHCSRHFKNL